MTSKMIERSKRGPGRPSTFERSIALREAMKLFWERGYEGTSFDALIDAMCISASSFYNSFGSKEEIYREATDAFLEASGKWFLSILGDETLETRTAFERLLFATAVEFTRDDLPAGCMISLAGTHVSPCLKSVREMMIEHRAVSERALVERLRKGIVAGDVSADVDVAALAAYFSVLLRGLAVQARDGASRERLVAIGRLAMRTWPILTASWLASGLGDVKLCTNGRRRG